MNTGHDTSYSRKKGLQPVVETTLAAGSLHTYCKSFLQPDLLARELEPNDSNQILLEALPPRAIKIVAQLAIIVHLAPAIASPFAASHVHQEISFLLIIMDIRIVSIIAASAGREGVYFSLRDECRVWPDPGVRGVEEFEGVLFFVFPFHVFLLVADGVPPDVEEAVGPGAAFNEEGAEVEAAAVLGDDEVDGGLFAVADWGAGDGVQVRVGEGVGNVEWIVDVNVSVYVFAKVVEDVGLKRIARLHYEGVKVEPPKPKNC
jgi:hypothetical protein